MTKLKNALFELDDLFFILRKFKFLNNFHRYFFVSLFLNSTIDWRKVPCSDFFHYLILIINTVFFKLLKVSKPFFLCWLVLKIVFLLRINTISMLYNYSCSQFILFLFHNQTLHILNFIGILWFFTIKDKDRGFY